MQYVKPLNREKKPTCCNALQVAQFRGKTSNFATLDELFIVKWTEAVIKYT